MKSVIGVDLGGTKVSLGKVQDQRIVAHYKTNVSADKESDFVVQEIIEAIDMVFDDSVVGIGIGVPSLVDVKRGIVYDVQNIPSWKEVHLQEILEARFDIPVRINNDANCFAVGEKYFGKARDYQNIVGATIGTGFGTGVIINNKLYSGKNCGAGEFGMLPYKDHVLEYYCSGQFFKNMHYVKGEEIYARAREGDESAIKLFDEFGAHVGAAVSTILYTVDPEIIIFGGSISNAYPLFQKTMWQYLESFAYQKALQKLQIEISEEPNIAVLGAAALYLDAHN